MIVNVSHLIDFLPTFTTNENIHIKSFAPIQRIGAKAPGEVIEIPPVVTGYDLATPPTTIDAI